MDDRGSNDGGARIFFHKFSETTCMHHATMHWMNDRGSNERVSLIDLCIIQPCRDHYATEHSGTWGFLDDHLTALLSMRLNAVYWGLRRGGRYYISLSCGGRLSPYNEFDSDIGYTKCIG
jgi:hypothetical protein